MTSHLTNKFAVEIEAFRKPKPGRTQIIGFADIRLPSLGIKLHRVTIMRLGDGIAARLPRSPVVHNGKHSRRPDGTTQWEATVTFVDFADHQVFSDAVVRAVRAAVPGVFS